MVAAHHRKQPLRIRELTLLDILDPSPVHSDRYIMFRFARDRAGMTSNAPPVVDNKTEICQFWLLASFTASRALRETLQANRSVSN